MTDICWWQTLEEMKHVSQMTLENPERKEQSHTDRVISWYLKVMNF